MVASLTAEDTTGLRPGEVMTVFGPVAAEQLGLTLSHEHLLCDGRAFVLEPATYEERAVVDLDVTAANRELVARFSCHVRANVRLDDLETAVAEAARFRAAGGRTIVEVTGEGISPRPLEIQEIAARTGLNIVMGCGPYCEYTLSPELVQRSVEEIAAAIRRDLTGGIGGTGIRAGVIGEIGVNGQRLGDSWRTTLVTACEERGLRGAARASLATGVPVIVHQPNVPEATLAIATILEDEGLPPDRVCLGHMSSVLDLDLHQRMAARGYWIAYDNLGMNIENAFIDAANDERRVAWLVELLRRGCEERILLSHDVWSKIQLARYGGNGYTHVLDVISPWLCREGVEQAQITRLLVENPARFLGARTGAVSPPCG